MLATSHGDLPQVSRSVRRCHGSLSVESDVGAIIKGTHLPPNYRCSRRVSHGMLGAPALWYHPRLNAVRLGGGVNFAEPRSSIAVRVANTCGVIVHA